MRKRSIYRVSMAIALAAILFGLLSGSAFAYFQGEWSQYQKDERNSGLMDVALPKSPNVLFRTENIFAKDGSQPAVSSNRAYVYAGKPGVSGAIHSYSLPDGKELWKRDVEPVSAFDSWSSPAVSNGVVYIGSGSKVEAIDALSGRILWSKDLSRIKSNAQIVNASPTVAGNYLYIGDYANGCYYCLDVTKKGALVWVFSCDPQTIAMSTPCVDGERVFVGQGAAFGASVSPNGKVWCLDRKTGKPVKSWGSNGAFQTVGKNDVNGSVTVYGKFIYFTDYSFYPAESYNCHLYCLNKETGKLMWKEKVFGSDGTPSVCDGWVITAGQQPAPWPQPGTNWVCAFKIDTDRGRKIARAWERKGIGGFNSSPAIAGNLVVVGNTDPAAWPITGQGIFALGIENGKTLWRSAEGGGSVSLSEYGILSIGGGKLVCFGSGRRAPNQFYFAEGCTRTGFQEWICLENPDNYTVNVSIIYMLGNGTNLTQKVILPPLTRTTVDVNAFVGPENDVSAKITGDGYFIAERAMYFENWGLKGGEQVLGATEPRSSMFFAEGTTREGFQMWLAIQNPEETEAKVMLTFLFADGSAPVQELRSVSGKSRETIDVNSVVGPGRDVSVSISSNKPVCAERMLYFKTPFEILGSPVDGVHNCVGIPEPDTNWFFAEGTTREQFREWISIMNPNSTAAKVTITYAGPEGIIRTIERSVNAYSRHTQSALEDVGSEKDISVIVKSDKPVIAERPMYFKYLPVVNAGNQFWSGGHNSPGSRETAYRWDFAEGTTREGFETFLCIANPGNKEANVKIDYFIREASGSTNVKSEEIKVPAKSRKTVLVNMSIGPECDVAISLVSDRPVIAERPMYFNYYGRGGGGVSFGYPTVP